MQTLRTAEELSVLAVVWQGKVCFLSTLHHCSSSFLEISTVRCKGAYLLSWEFSIPLKRCNNCSGLLDKGHTPPKTDRTFPENFQSYIESELSSLLSEFLQSLCALLKAFCLVLIRSTLLPCLHIGQCPRKGNFAVFLHLRAGKTHPFFFFSFSFPFPQISLPKVAQQRPLLLQAFLKAHFHELLFTALSKQMVSSCLEAGGKGFISFTSCSGTIRWRLQDRPLKHNSIMNKIILDCVYVTVCVLCTYPFFS